MTIPARSKAAGLAACILGAIATLTAVIAVPEGAEALRCKTVARVKLTQVDPSLVPKIRGKAMAVSCSDGSSLLEVQVKTKLPDGTAYVPALPGLQPVLGDFFFLTKNKGLGEILNVAVDQIHGRAVSVYDQDFVEVLSATFP